jgi:UDP-2,3-diacylglucosamine hydrolase
MHGNRDFLIGGRFCNNTGCKLIADGKAITVYGRRIVVMHGDTLCTDDRDYQRLRRIVRNPLVKLVFRCMSLRQRQNLAAKIRAGSKAHIESSMERIMDVNDAAVAKAFDKHRVDLIIHGHTHRPFVHSLRVNSKPVTRIVLGDWYSQGSVLRWNEQGYELSSLRRSDLDR